MTGTRRLQIAAIVAGLIVAREAGAWSLLLVSTRSTTSRTTLNMDFADGRPCMPLTPPLAPGLANATDEGAGDAILAEFERQVAAMPLVEGRVTALRIDRVKTTGCRWLPLYKPMGGHVEASFAVDRARDGATVTRRRMANIDVDLSVVGLCSARDARVEFAKVVVASLVQSAAEP